MSAQADKEFDLTPDPRVLQMLGEISLQQWRCLAELIDNAVDGFVHAVRAGSPIHSPEICVALPTADRADARVTISDNGPGMSFEILENAVRAGWTGNDPLSNLGLFGMGFNIATARLGMLTDVWTSRAGDAEEVGVRIDLEELRTTRSFRVPRQTRAKADPASHGTTIVVSKLKPDQRAYLARSGNQKTIRKQLARTYSSLLASSEAGKIHLVVGGVRLPPRLHCVWSEERVVQNQDGTESHAVEYIDVKLAPRRYCTGCMRTLANDEESCSENNPECNVVGTERRIHGWLGLQRNLHATEFGIDFIRNGRKIEIGNKELFAWSDGEVSEIEYPVDDQRGRGRFVGEINIDHCRVSYTKDRFERDDPSWSEMLRVVRGEGPLRPLVAKQRGYGANESPLYRLYQAFRRTSPQGKNGLWSRILVVKDNDRAVQMAGLFEEGDAEYLTDERWWQLVLEQDKAALGESTTGESSSKLPDEFLDNSESAAPEPNDQDGQGAGNGAAEEAAEIEPPERAVIHDLTRKYVHPTYRVEYEVVAYSVSAGDPQLSSGSPWAFKLDDVATRTYAYLVDSSHDIFRSTTMTPLDALLFELSHRSIEFLKGHVQNLTIGDVLADFRREYSGETQLNASEMIGLSGAVLSEIARAVPSLIPGGSGQALFDELGDGERETIARRMGQRGVQDHSALIADGRFLDYAAPESLRGLFNRHPEIFLDGHFWDEPYATLNLWSAAASEEARAAVRSRYDAYLNDAVWLANQMPSDVDRAARDVLIRAACSVRLLKSDLREQ